MDADRHNESCQLSLHDQNTVEFLTTNTNEGDDESVGSCSVRSGRTLTGIRHEPDNDLDEGENDNIEGDPAVFDAVDYLKHLGSMKKIPFNKSSLTDLSELMVDRAEAQIKKQRDKFATWIPNEMQR